MTSTSLNIDLDTFSFAQREKRDGKTVKNRCGRDFLYYALHYYLPEKYNNTATPPHEIERSGLFGWRVGTWFMWMMLQFLHVPALLKQEGLGLSINGMRIHSFAQLLIAVFVPCFPTYEKMIKQVEAAVRRNNAVGIDISLGWFGIYDHVLFVHGFDEKNLYVLDTHKIPPLEYEKMTTDERYVMRLPKDIVKKRISWFSRVWEVKSTYYLQKQ